MSNRFFIALFTALAVLGSSFTVQTAAAAGRKPSKTDGIDAYNGGYKVPRGTWRPLAGKRNRGRKTHFIEFRARNALSYGHTSVVLGRLNKGDVARNRAGVLNRRYVDLITGLHPRSNNPTVYAMGHVVPLPASTAASDGDDEDAYTLAKYRIDLTAKEYRQVKKLVQARKRASKFWYAPVYACVHYTADIARDIGLKTPYGLNLPEAWVKALARKNGSRAQTYEAWGKKRS